MMMMLRNLIALIVSLFLLTSTLFSQISEQQVLVLYNSQVADSEDVFLYYKSQPNRGNVLGFDFNDATLTGPDISYADFVTKIRNPLRTHLATNNLESQIIVFVLTKGIPHRIQDINSVTAGDLPLDALNRFQNGNANFASVDSDLMFLWQDLDTGEAGGSFDSVADNVVINPYFRSNQSISSFNRAGSTGVAQTNKPFIQSGQVWIMTDSSFRSSDAGDLYLTSRLDGNSLEAVRGLIDRGQSPSYDPSSDIVIIDRNEAGTFDLGDYDETNDLLSSRWRNIDFDGTADFLIGNNGVLSDTNAPTRTITGQVSILATYGGNHDNFVQTDYLSTFKGQLASGSIFNSYESFNGRDFNGAGGFSDQGQLADWVDAGGGFGIGNVWEPFTVGVPRNVELLDAFLYRGLTWVEAAWSSLQLLSWQTTVIGDPLAVATVSELRNSPPTGTAKTVSVNENTSVVIGLEGVDADGDDLSFEIVSSPTNGIISGSSPNFTYTPSANFVGSDSFTFTASDGFSTSDPVSVSITILNVNELPIADQQQVQTTEDTALAVVLSASDTDGDTLSYTITTQPSNGSISGTAPNLTYTPNANFNGSDSLAFSASDGTGSGSATISIIVSAVNDVPTASPITTALAEDSSAQIVLQGSDIDGDDLSYLVTTSPANGSLSGDAPNLIYTPAANFNGTDSFAYRVNDGTANSSSVSVSISVNSVNDLPIASNLSAIIVEDSSVQFDLSGTDADNNALTFAFQQPQNGSVTGSGSSVTYTPNSGFFGGDEFTYTANDGSSDSSPATVSITIQEAPLVGYEGFLEVNELSDTNFETDSDGDGVSNGLEYIIGSDPNVRDSATYLRSFTITDTSTVIRFERNSESTLDTNQTFQFSNDLETWNDLNLQSPLSEGVVIGAAEEGVQPITITINKSTDQLYWRLVAVQRSEE